MDFYIENARFFQFRIVINKMHQIVLPQNRKLRPYNARASNYFTPESGVRQGCPLSRYIFILCAEILANKIRENKDIKGITVCGSEVKICQYAHDTTMILDGSKKFFTSVLLDLELFGVISGLRINNKKTEISLDWDFH